ncbi:putative hemolysin [Budvicia diplopodorum]|uniref:putative hemolysin n=1 Tax=Budvicia diplopodorum TaxID=1119056 RepID=UPI001359826D|nr:DUF333 domain-containing protein [Budvicia diplopodorum]
MKIIFIALVSLSIFGCSANQPETDKGSNRQIGMANPASVYCIEKGGKLAKMTTGQGVSSDCILPSGERIDQWELYRRDHK